MVVRCKSIVSVVLAGLACLVTAKAAAPTIMPFLTSYSNAAPLRNNYTGYVGMQFTVGNAPIYLAALSRQASGGTQNQSHILKLVNAQTGVDIATTSSFSAGYSFLPQSLLLPANSSYFLVSQETAGGDSWYDYEPVTSSGAGTVNGIVYLDAGGHYVTPPNTAGYSYVPVNFLYSTTPPPSTVTILLPQSGGAVSGITPFVASATPGPGLTITTVQFQISSTPAGIFSNLGSALTQSPYSFNFDTTSLPQGTYYLQAVAGDSGGNTVTSDPVGFETSASQASTLITGFSTGYPVRNNYTGFVGLEFAVGNAPLTVSALGRLALPGGSQSSHILKLVDAQTGMDFPGGSVSITLTNPAAPVFQYALLPAPINLPASHSYLLLSQESAGGDTWFDYEPVTGVTSAAAIVGPVYQSQSGYVLVSNSANYSYVPVNLRIQSGPGTPGATTITSPAANSIFLTGPITFAATAAPTTVSLQFQLDGQNYGTSLTVPPYSLTFDSGLIDGASHTLTAVATDSGANMISSTPVSFVVAPHSLPFIGGVPNAGVFPSGSLSGKFFGTEFTVGAKPLTLTRLARFFPLALAPIDLTFAIKIVDAATGADVPGAAVTVTFGYATDSVRGGLYLYANLPAAVTLQANKAYFLVSHETSSALQGGGNKYFEGSLITPGAGVLNFPVYQDANGIYQVDSSSPGYAYDILNFDFDTDSEIPPAPVIAFPSPNSTLAGTSVAQVSSTGDPLPLTSLQLQVDGVNVGAAVSGRPTYQIPLDTTAFANGPHSVAVVATDQAAVSGSSSINATFNNPAPAVTSGAFVTSVQGTFLRNNFSGFLGFEFTVAAAPLQINSLGRLCLAGNTHSHAVKLVQAAAGSDLPGGAVTVNMNGCAVGQYVYAALGSPATLPAGSSYFLVDAETFNGDQWYDYSPLSTGSAAAVNAVVYQDSSGHFVTPSNTAGYGYVPLNFLYANASPGGNPGFAVTLNQTGPYNPLSINTLTAAVTRNLPGTSVQLLVDGTPLGSPVTAAPYVLPVFPVPSTGTHALTAIARDSAGNSAVSAPVLIAFGGGLDVIHFNGGALRNNFSGWVGFRFTTGPSGGTSLDSGPRVDSIGRLCLAGNSMTHLLKLVRASDGTDVSGASALALMAGCAPGSLVDSSMPGSVTLAPNTSYYLVSREMIGGDQWYEFAPATPIPSITPGPVPPAAALAGFYYPPTGATFTIDGPVYSAADGSLVFVPLANHSYVGLGIGGLSTLVCGSGVCQP